MASCQLLVLYSLDMQNSKRVRHFFLFVATLLPAGVAANDNMTLEQAVAVSAARGRWERLFRLRGLPYPPERVAFLAFKKEKRLEVRVFSRGGWLELKKYVVRKASGQAGPKLREGDRQVPEGIYRITNYNPRSKFYLSLKLNFPNEFDLKNAEAEDRKEPGSDIYIHGKEISTGCLAMGDPAMEEIYALALDAGKENISVVIAPNDLRRHRPITDLRRAPSWTAELYSTIKSALLEYSKPPEIPKSSVQAPRAKP